MDCGLRLPNGVKVEILDSDDGDLIITVHHGHQRIQTFMVRPSEPSVVRAVQARIRGSDLAATVESDINEDPPAIAEFLLELFLRHKEGIVGDLRERYRREYRSLGRKRAQRRYWAECARTVMPLLRRALSKAIRWGVLIGVGAFLRHWHG
jgi:hypothetical protein